MRCAHKLFLSYFTPLDAVARHQFHEEAWKYSPLILQCPVLCRAGSLQTKMKSRQRRTQHKSHTQPTYATQHNMQHSTTCNTVQTYTHTHNQNMQCTNSLSVAKGDEAVPSCFQAELGSECDGFDLVFLAEINEANAFGKQQGREKKKDRKKEK